MYQTWHGKYISFLIEIGKLEPDNTECNIELQKRNHFSYFYRMRRDNSESRYEFNKIAFLCE